jgi:hypothetical protein
MLGAKASANVQNGIRFFCIENSRGNAPCSRCQGGHSQYYAFFFWRDKSFRTEVDV